MRSTDASTVIDSTTQQCGRFAALNIPLVDDGSWGLSSGALELKPSGQKIIIADIECAGSQPLHIHLSPLPKEDAIGVDQKHFARGVQLTENLRGIVTNHPVKTECRIYIDLVIGTNIEGLVVDDGIVAGVDI